MRVSPESTRDEHLNQASFRMQGRSCSNQNVGSDSEHPAPGGEHMKTRDLNVAEQLWDDEKADIFGRIYEPENPSHPLPPLFCIPGGTYTPRYWDLDVVGGGFSFAEELTSRGYFVVAIDNLGTGASSRPVHRAGLADSG